MADRKQFLSAVPADAEFNELFSNAKQRKVTEEELHEQRVSFAFGNAPDSEEITKDTVRRTSASIRLMP